MKKFAGNAMRLIPNELRWLLRQTRPYLAWHVASAAAILAASLLTLLDPLIMRWLIDSVLPSRNGRALLIAMAGMFVSYAGRSALNALGGYCTFTASQRLVLDLRMRLMRQLAAMSADYHTATPAGAKTYLIRDTVQEIALLGGDLAPATLRIVLLGGCVLGAMFALDRTLTLLLLPILPLAVILNRRLRRSLHGSSDAVLEQHKQVSSAVHDFTASILQIQLLSRERRLVNSTYHSFVLATRVEHRRKLAEIRFTVLSSLMIVLGITLMIGVGGYQVVIGQMSAGSLVAFYSYLVRLFEPLYGAVEISSRFQRVGANLRSIIATLQAKPTICDAPGARALLSSGPATVVFANVSFGYAASMALRGFSLHVQAGKRVALVGSNGAGKSTAGKLAARLYDPVSGAVLVDGEDIRCVTLKSLRRRVTYVPQEPALFDCTLEENLRLAKPDATRAELERAAEIADLDGLLAALPDGWKEKLGPGGRLLSGGERQRLAVARAVLTAPGCLVLDECTAALDPTAEKCILQRLDSYLPETTIVFVSHRISAITWVDRIVVLNAGQIVEDGIHRELYGRRGLYARLYDDQLAHREAVGEPAPLPV
jgi:subfamily B ATP-binding cassette protein MsbA